MEYKSSYDRIDNVTDIDYISRNICKDYKLGNFKKSELIEIGYEDFNYFLYTDDNKYVVKVFNTERENSSCDRLINILIKSYQNGVPIPMIYKCNDNYIYEIEVDGVKLKLFIMEYVGKDFWSLNKTLSLDELNKVAKIAASINVIDYGIKEPFYDEWTVTNLCEEYNKKKDYLSKEDYPVISKIVEEFSKLDFTKFKYAYVHGDMIKANLLLDDNNKLYVIDFSDFNYSPRIVELNAILLGLCLTDDREETIKRMNYFLMCYDRYNPIDNYELEKLPLMLKSLASMFIIQSSYIDSNMGDYTENNYWLSEGRKYLKMNITEDDIKIEGDLQHD